MQLIQFILSFSVHLIFYFEFFTQKTNIMKFLHIITDFLLKFGGVTAI
jgi:hypothetical protein